MKNLVQVHMLPTEDDSNIIKDNLGIMYYYNSLKKAAKGFTNQHLYFTSDEEIKEGDWFIKLRDVYPTGLGDIHLCERDLGNEKRTDKGWTLQAKYGKEVVLRKVVATTDTKLTKPQYSEEDNFECAVSSNIKLIAQSFIEEYVKAGGIDEVLLEYLEHIHPDLGKVDETIKTDGNNCVITSPVEHKLYTKEEVESILFQYAEDEHAWFSCKSEIESFNNWIKENLK